MKPEIENVGNKYMDLDWTRTALVVVDVQNDFISGSLAVPDAIAVIPVCNQLVQSALANKAPIVFTMDRHREDNEEHFRSWPKHCIVDTEGQKLHPDLVVPQEAFILWKGEGEKDDGYSAFEGYVVDTTGWGSLGEGVTNYVRFDKWLERKGITHLLLCGLATDYCVEETALDGIVNSYLVSVVKDGCRGVTEAGAAVAIEDMERYGVRMV